jgi:hypothetical protein
MTWDASIPAIAVAGFAVPEKDVRNVSQPRRTEAHASSKGRELPRAQRANDRLVHDFPLFTLTAVRAQIRDRRKSRLMRYLPCGVVAAAVLAFSGRGKPAKRSLAGNDWQMGSLP